MTEFSRMRKIGGCLPIEDHRLIGDGTAAALVGRDGAINSNRFFTPRSGRPAVEESCSSMSALRLYPDLHGVDLGLVLANNVLAPYVFWELTSISSYFLIGFDHNRESARDAALQAVW
jgi:hypothetical protein